MFQKVMKQLRGDEVLAKDGRIGVLDDIYFDGEGWQVHYLLVSTDDGQPEPQVLISSQCANAGSASRRVCVDLSRGEIEFTPAFWPVAPVSRWLARASICSGREIIGFGIEAQDAPAGRVADLLVDDDDWSIHYLVVDVGGEASERHVLMPLDWVRAVDLDRRAVQISRMCEDVHRAPAV